MIEVVHAWVTSFFILGNDVNFYAYLSKLKLRTVLLK